MDRMRRAQGEAMERLGYGPEELPHRIAAAGPIWRLRDYGGSFAGAPLLIVPAPIKRPYIWDLMPAVSAVRYCLRRGFRVFVLDWAPPSPGGGGGGLEDYAGSAIGAAAQAVADRAKGRKPILVGHSLGGTFAAIFAACQPSGAHGLVMLGAPLCFRPGANPFRDAIVALAPKFDARTEIVPGSLLSQISALASPETFVWGRMRAAAAGAADSRARDLLARIERWTLDETPLPGALVRQVLQWLYREDRFCSGTLRIGGRTAGPSRIRIPVLAAASPADIVAPPGSVEPFLRAVPGRDAHLLEYPGEPGVGLQHLGILVGRRTRTLVWPRIVDWLNAHS